MTAITTITASAIPAPVTVDIPANLVSLKGAGKARREAAFAGIALSAYVATQSWADMLDNIKVALGKTPTVDDVKLAQREFIIGRVTARLPAPEFPNGIATDSDRLAHVRALVTSYAAPDAKAVRKTQLGRRSQVQHKAIRAAEVAWVAVTGELGLGGQSKEVKKAKRGARGKNATTAPTVTAPTHTELVTPAAPLTPADVVNHLTTQSTALMQFCKKNGGIAPANMAALTNKYRADMLALANEWTLEQEAKDAIKAERAK